MSKDNVKITIHFPSLGKKVNTDSDTLHQLAKDLKDKRKGKRLFDLANSTKVKEKIND